jgi:hypothetical protein
MPKAAMSAASRPKSRHHPSLKDTLTEHFDYRMNYTCPSTPVKKMGIFYEAI